MSKHHKLIEEILVKHEKEEQEREQREAQRRMAYHQALLNKAIEQWSDLGKLVESGALRYDPHTGELRGGGLAPMRLREHRWGVEVEVWSDAIWTRFSDLDEAIAKAARAAATKSEQDKNPPQPICPLDGEACGSTCAWWVDGGCAVVAIAKALAPVADELGSVADAVVDKMYGTR